MAIRDIVQAAAGNTGEAIYVEDVFSTWLYTGNGKTQVIENGIALGSAYGGSVYFNGSATLTVPDNAAFDFGTGDFTVEFWINKPNTDNGFVITCGVDTAAGNWNISWFSSSLYWQSQYGVTNLYSRNASSLENSGWNHVAITRASGVQRMFFNGVLQGATVSDTTNYVASNNIQIGLNGLVAYLSNVRLVKGTAVYTSNFTPSTIPLTNISGTSLLCCQAPSPTTDYSSNAFTITASATASYAGYGPFTDNSLGQGGLVWIKNRDTAGYYHVLCDTARGKDKWLSSNDTAAESTASDICVFNSGGFSAGPYAYTSENAKIYTSWTFRKAAKFFDVVTYTGDGVNGRNIAHNLGSTPGCMIIKCTSQAYDWMVYHRSAGSPAYDYRLRLNTTAAAASSSSSYWGGVDPTSTQFTLGNNAVVNESGQTYVAYLFAHDAGGFGLSGSDNVISCGSFTTSGSGTATVTLGYEPQLTIQKSTSATGNWFISDNMRGMPVGAAATLLRPNTSGAESSGGTISPTATGFSVSGYPSSTTYIYIAIRRGPMETPTSGTSVYTSASRTGTAGVIPRWTAGFPVDWALRKSDVTTGGGDWQAGDRLRGAVQLKPNLTEAETSASPLYTFDSMTGYSSLGATGSNTSDRSWMFRRAPGFFDVVCYTGNGTAGRTINHNLGVAPEMMWVKARSASGEWWNVYTPNNKGAGILILNQTSAYSGSSAYWNNTDATSSVFTVGSTNEVNASGVTYVAYLFASCPGVSKVGSYTGNGTSQTINCGFTNGSRFVLIKRTDSTGDWYVWDSARGIVAGNDPYLLLNSTAAEVTNTDYVDTYSAGFEITSTAPAAINANGGTFIFLAIA